MSEPITTLREHDIQAIAAMGMQAAQGEIGYWEIYSHLRTLLVTEYAIPENNPTILWLAGAAEANAGRGMYSAMIRAYSNTQGELRYGVKFDDAQMQAASNQVAQQLLKDLLGEADDEWDKGDVPALERIGFADATGLVKFYFPVTLMIPQLHHILLILSWVVKTQLGQAHYCLVR